MRLKYLVLAATLAPAAAFAQTSLTTANYQQNFDTLASSGSTSSTLPAGVTFIETGSGANNSYGIGNGSSNAGNTYSFGATGGTDRALGSLGSGSVESTFGFLFTNGLGSTITGFDLSYVGEQWRRGGSTVDGLTFAYSTNATSLTTGTWTQVSALSFLPVSITGSDGALDGNLAANQRNLSATISGLNIAQGGNFAFRWIDLNSDGIDHGLAIDNFNLRANLAAGAVPEPATWAMMLLGFGAIGTMLRNRARTATRIRFA